jgi:transposase
MDYFIGLDAHSSTSTFVVVTAGGKIVATATVRTTEKELRTQLETIRGKKSLAIEVSTLSKWLYALLKDEVDELLVCDPGRLHKGKGPKNDESDAERLAQALRGGFLKPVFHDESFFYDLRKLVNSYRRLVWDLARIKNRYKALFRSQAILTPGTRVYSQPSQIQRIEGHLDQFIAQSYFDLIESYEQQRKDFVQKFKVLESKNTTIKSLATIPGISSIRACIIAAAIASPERFEDKHKFWSYAMLVRHAYESGGKVYGRVQVRARADLKDVFLGAAESIIKNESELFAYYESLLKKGQHRREARKGLARKVAAISLRVMRTQQPFQEEWKEAEELAQIKKPSRRKKAS